MGRVHSAGVILPTGFRLSDSQPISDDMIWEFIADLPTIPNQYIGKEVFILENESVYLRRAAGWQIQTGVNISNANLTFAASRTHNLGGNKVTFTNGRFGAPTLELEVTTATSIPNKLWFDNVKAWFTNSLGINSALVSDDILNTERTGIASFSKVMTLNPTTKEQGVRDFADPSATTLAVQNATTVQKAAMRVALLGAAVPASPVVNLVNTWFVRRGTDKMLFLSGVNLTPLDPVAIWIENGATKIFATNYFSISTNALQTFWTIPISFPTGDYPVKLTFGAVVQGASPGIVRVLENSASLAYNFTTADFIARARSGFTLLTTGFSTGVVSNNIFRVSKRSTTDTSSGITIDSAIKTSNIFQGALTSSWEIILEITSLFTNTGAADQSIGMILTETINADFASPSNLVNNYVLLENSGRNNYTNSNSQVVYNSNGAVGFVNSVVIRKTGNVVAVFGFNPSTGFVNAYSEAIIDTTKTYALAIMDSNTRPEQFAKEFKISATILNS